MTEKSKSHHPERVILTVDSLGRVNRWIETLTPRLKGSKVSRTDLVNWLISKQPGELPSSMVSELECCFFDPVKALGWASEEIQRRQKAGEMFDVKEFMVQVLQIGAKPTLRSRPLTSMEQSTKMTDQHLGISNGKVATKKD